MNEIIMEKKLSTYFSTYFFFFAISFFLVSCSPKLQGIVEENNHIHAIAFDPTELEVMYVATHHYLEKIDLESGDKERIGRYGDDFMGFVIASDGTFYSSGHSPDVANVGIRKSTDKGKTWQTLAYEGYDFHDMAVSPADTPIIYAWSTPPREFLTVSGDGGNNWNEVETKGLKGSILSLGTDHQRKDVLYAGTLYGLFFSDNEGKNWQEITALKNNPVIAIADDPVTEGIIYISTARQGVLKTKNSGKLWEELNQGSGGIQENLPISLTVNSHIPEEVYAITKHSKIYIFQEGDENGNGWKEFSLK